MPLAQISLLNYTVLLWSSAFTSWSECIGASDRVVDRALAFHLCDPGSNPGVVMWEGSGRPSEVGGFLRVLRVLRQYRTTNAQTSVPSRVFK